MHWIALQWRPEAAAPAARPAPSPAVPGLAPEAVPAPPVLAWWALGLTPHVAWVDEALLLEVSACERLWGGRAALLRRIFESNPAPALVHQAQAATSLVALARLRLAAAGHAPPAAASGLPLHTLSAARAHLDVLARLGCRTWGQLDALPRAGLARRFGPALGRALDVALGRAPDVYAWQTPPEDFDQALELPARIVDAPALLWSAQRLLAALQLWLRARQRGVLAFELQWHLEPRRAQGRALAPTQSLLIRTAEPAQASGHLRRLLAERLARTTLPAPAVRLRLRSIETAPWTAASASFLPEAQRHGDALHVFIERVGARLGADSVQSPRPHADHRPERMQSWHPAQPAPPSAAATAAAMTKAAAMTTPATAAARAGPAPSGGDGLRPDALAPAWLLREPLALAVQADGRPCHHGPLRLLSGPRRIEAGWWADALPDQGQPAARDYYIAQNPAAELLWIYRERATAARHAGAAAPRWFLQGLYA